ncbi:MAG: DUF2461 domain-containing protein [Cyclobacteriaceae bacterium]
MAVIEKTTLIFLKDLAKNNNREWFVSHKSRYLEAQANMILFIDQLIEKMNEHDRLETQSGKESLYRIYNDVRFSTDKTPYNPRFAGNLRRQKPMLRGGYYYWIKPGQSRVGCGFTYPSAEDLLRIRQDIDTNHKQWRRLINSKVIQTHFGEMLGDQVKTAPRGFDKDHTAIDLLRYKQFWFEHSFTDKEVIGNDFLDQVNKTFKSIRPFFNFMSETLTTDLNGERRL